MVYTDYRPTPLQHFAFPCGGDGLFLVVDERGTFRQDNFAKAIAALTDTAADGGAPAAAACTGPRRDRRKRVAVSSGWPEELLHG